MVDYVHQNVLNGARELHAQGQFLEAWQVLADVDAPYAKATCHISSNTPSLLTYFRHAHWELVTHEDMNSELWNKAALLSLGHYLDILESKRDDFLGEAYYKLPNSREIEQCHIRSISECGLPRQAVIHLVSNSITTRFNKFCGLEDGPDWFEPLEHKFGSMGERGVDNSEEFSMLGFWGSAWLLCKAAGVGTKRYVDFRAREIAYEAAPYIASLG